MNRLDPTKLTPGVLDGYALRAFKYGACGALAIALHEETGWPIVAITDAHNVEDGRAGGGSALHWTVRHPSGLLLDVDGLHREEDLVSEYAGDADDGQAAAGLSTRADCASRHTPSPLRRRRYRRRRRVRPQTDRAAPPAARPAPV